MDPVVVKEGVGIHKVMDVGVVAHIAMDECIVTPMVIATTLEQNATLRNRTIRLLQLSLTGWEVAPSVATRLRNDELGQI